MSNRAPEGLGGPVLSAAPVRRWTIGPHAEELQPLRTEVRAAARGWGIDAEECEDLVLIVSELVSNSIEHAHSTSRVLLRRLPHEAHVVVADATTGGPQLQPHDVTATRGRGLQMIDRVAARWGWAPRSCGKLIWARLDFQLR